MPQISIIVPVYQTESYLSRCIDSILAQTFTDFEVILIDDGSIDRCPEMCDAYAQRDERISVIHQKNKGIAAVRNTGIARARGEWLSFVDSDDWIHPCMLEFLFRAANERHTAISACEYTDVDHYFSDFEPVSYIVETMRGLDYYVFEKEGQTVVVWNKLFRKTLFAKIHFPEGRLHEDAFIIHKLLYLAGEISVLRVKLHYYFTNPNGITHSNYTPERLDSLYAHEQQCLFFEKLHMPAHYQILFDKQAPLYWYHTACLREIGCTKQAKELTRHGKKFFLCYLLKCFPPLRNSKNIYRFLFPRIANTYGTIVVWKQRVLRHK